MTTTPPPTAQVVASPKDGEFTVTATNGKTFTYRPLDALDIFDLGDAAGNTENVLAQGIANVAAGTRAIDGHPVLFPDSRQKLRTRIKEVGNEGISAITEELARRAEQSPPMSVEDQKDRVKN